jgi:formamidopyrimidine-DNA glycosylase
MPELPDVEVFKRYFDATSLHQEIEGVEVGSTRVLRGTSQSGLAEGLKDRSFVSTNRHGKYLLAHFDNRLVMVLHFGMTGYLKYFKQTEKDPLHDRLMITFANGFHLAYDSQRKLGEIRLIGDEDDFIHRQKRLGPDALRVPLPDFRDILSASRAAIKSALMNQQRLAGIGNVYSDEILFQAGIHPGTKARDLDEKILEKLFESMEDVLEKAIALRADPKEFPGSFIIPHRDGDGKCPRCSVPLQSEKTAGRTAYFCPKCQNA